MKTAMQELIDYIESNEIVYNKDLILKLKELLEKEKEQQLNLIRFVRLNDKMGKSIVDLLNEFYNQNK